MTHPNARAAEVAKEARRRKVAAMLLAGVTDQTTIAGKVGCDRTTVCRDVKAIEADWRERVAADVQGAKGKDDARLERLYAAAFAKATKGDVGAINACVKILARRAAMWGYDAPTKIDLRTYAEELARQTGVAAGDILATAETIAAGAWDRLEAAR
jgi:hypothetical protein